MNILDLNILFNQAVANFQENRLAEAETLAKRILSVSPNNHDATFLLGIIAGKRGQYDESSYLITSAIQSNPQNSAYHFNLGLVLQSGGRLEEAVVAYEQATRLKPKFVEAHYQLGTVLEDLGRLGPALSSYDRAIKYKPQNAALHKNRAIILWKLGRQEESLAVCERVTKLSPGDAGGYYNLGNALYGMGRLVAAVSAFDRAIQLNLEYAEAYSNLGIVLKDMCRLDEAEVIYRRVLELNQGNATAHSNLLFLLAARAKLSPAQMIEELRHWDQVHGRDGRSCLLPVRAVQANESRRLRVGYVSPDLHVHAVSSFFEPLLAAHDRSRFEIFCYAASDEHLSDATTERLRGLSEHWRLVAKMNDSELARLVYDDGIDVLVDLAGHTGGGRLKAFTYRPAPVQATYLGYFAATGLEAMDYWITDEVVHPPDTTEPTIENIYRLNRCSLCYLPSAEAPLVSPCPSVNDEVIFCSVSDISKLTPEVIETWSRILYELPGSRLLLTTKALSESTNRQLLLGQFAQFGISSERMLMRSTLSHREWLATYAQVDIVLDPFPRTGCTTTAEALWMGVPVVTLAGLRYVERASATVLAAVGLLDLITHSRESYIAEAISLARDPARRAALRMNLRTLMAKSPLRDGIGLARAMESAYLAMWKKYLSKNSME